MFLARHKTVSSGAALPAQSEQGGPEGQRPACPMFGSWPWDGPAHLRRWCCSLVPVEEVTAHPPPGSPYVRGRRRSIVEKEVKTSF